MITLLDYHNQFRIERGLNPFEGLDILNHYAQIDSRWMGRRRFFSYWNFAKREQELLANGFSFVTYNIATGDSEDIIMKHLLNDRIRSDKVYGDFTHFGWGCFSTNYVYWTMIYCR